jgi:hippurate hydrolase
MSAVLRSSCIAVLLCAVSGGIAHRGGAMSVAAAQTPAIEPRPEHDAAVQRWLSGRAAAWLGTYRSLHAHPELSLQERKTSALVARELERAGYRVLAGIGGFGVAGVLRNGKGPTLLLRGDMDALPVAEQTGLPYASRVTAKNDKGETVAVMHACGHDLHVVNLLASAAFMAEQRALWSGTLLIIAQPAEELGEGASRMIADRLFERVPRPDYALAMHADPELPAGHVGATSGWAAANADSVDVTLFGRGGHGARPQDAVDPIVAAAHFVTALQTLVSRRNDPREPAVVTVGSIHGGTKGNVIPDSVHLQLTVRSYSDAVRERLLAGVADLARDVCVAFRCPKPPDVRMKQNYTPAVYNDPALTAAAQRVFSAVLGANAVESVEPTMGAEDFGRYGKTLGIPSLLFRLGATPPARFAASKQPGAAPLPSLHSSAFAPDVEVALPTGVRATVALALAVLARSPAAHGVAPSPRGGAASGRP